MGKYFFMKFHVDDWLTDPNKQMLTYECKGFWMDLICYLFKSKTRGRITGTYQQIGNLMGVDSDTVERLILMLKDTNTADVTISNGKVTVVNRRIEREERKRTGGAQRVAKHRAGKSNADVTLQELVTNDNTKEDIPEDHLHKVQLIAKYFAKHRIIEKDISDAELEKWADEIYKLVRIDEETFADISRVVKWVLGDEFWSTVVHSPLKFRRKDKGGTRYWDKLKALSKGGNSGRQQTKGETDYEKETI